MKENVVSQRVDNDCVICAIANTCGYTYEKVYSKLTPQMIDDLPTGGLGSEQVMELLESLKIVALERAGRVLSKDYKVSTNGNKALIILDKGAEIRHMVAWDGFKIVESCKKYSGRYNLEEWGMVVGGGSLSGIILKTNRSHRKASLRKTHETR